MVNTMVLRTRYLSMLLLAVISSGCFHQKIGRYVERKASEKVDGRLRSLYGIEPNDSLKIMARKMFKVEKEKDPNVAATLLAIGPEAWDEVKKLSDSNKSWSEKFTAAKELGTKLKTALEESKDENGNTKLISGSTGVGLALIIMRMFSMYRKEKKRKEGMMDATEHSGPDAKKAMKESMKKVIDTDTLADIARDVEKRFPRTEKKVA